MIVNMYWYKYSTDTHSVTTSILETVNLIRNPDLDQSVLSKRSFQHGDADLTVLVEYKGSGTPVLSTLAADRFWDGLLAVSAATKCL